MNDSAINTTVCVTKSWQNPFHSTLGNVKGLLEISKGHFTNFTLLRGADIKICGT